MAIQDMFWLLQAHFNVAAICDGWSRHPHDSHFLSTWQEWCLWWLSNFL